MRAGLLLLAMAALPGGQDKPADVEPLKVDEKAGRVSFGARVAKLDVYEQLKGAIEYAIVLPKGKEYEALFIAPVDPIALRDGLVKIGLKTGRPAGEEDGKRTAPQGSGLRIRVEWKDGDKDRKEPLESFILDVHTGKAMAAGPWIFAGSREGFVPELEGTGLLVQATKNLISLYHNDNTVLVQPERLPKDEHSYKARKDVLPKPGTAVRIAIEAAK